MKKKNQAKLMFLGILVFAGLAVYFLYNQGYLKFGDPQLCDTDHNDPNCYCQSDYVKKTYERFSSGDQYYCQSSNPIINIDSPTFTTDFQGYAEAKFATLFPDCTMKTCNQGKAQWVIASGLAVGSPDNYVFKDTAKIECRDEFQQVTWAEMYIDVETGEPNGVNPPFCTDYVDKEQIVGGSILWGSASIYGLSSDAKTLKLKFYYHVECTAVGDIPSGEVAYNMPDGLMLSCGSNADCRIDGNTLYVKFTKGAYSGGACENLGGWSASIDLEFPVISNTIWCGRSGVQSPFVAYGNYFLEGNYACFSNDGLSFLGIGKTNDLKQCQGGQWVITQPDVLNCQILSDGEPSYQAINTDGSCTTTVTTAKNRLTNGQVFCDRYGKWFGNCVVSTDDNACTGVGEVIKYFGYVYKKGICQDGAIKILGTDLETCTV